MIISSLDYRREWVTVHNVWAKRCYFILYLFNEAMADLGHAQVEQVTRTTKPKPPNSIDPMKEMTLQRGKNQNGEAKGRAALPSRHHKHVSVP